jgi:Oxidoreductase molybdopterin binding domain
MRHPWVNTLLLILLLAQLATGVFGLVNGDADRRWVYWLHGIGGWAIVALLAWKGAVIVDSLARRKRAPAQRPVYLILTGLLLATLATGFIWTSAGRIVLFGYSLMTVHHVLAYVLVGLLASHVLYMRFILSVPDAHDRRAFLRLAVVSFAGVVAWQLSGAAKALLDLPGAARRFTGSYETGSHTGRFPTVSWFSDDPDRIDAERWRLSVGGEVERPFTLGYADVERRTRDAQEALIDCTGGWYSVQDWEGFPLRDLLEEAGVRDNADSVSLVSVTGYGRRFSLDEACGFLLATRVGGRELTHGHGFPLRLVAADHRGFDWVKWVVGVEVNGGGEWFQPPVPLQ